MQPTTCVTMVSSSMARAKLSGTVVRFSSRRLPTFRTGAFSQPAATALVLRGVAGRISDCEIGDIAKGGLFSEDAAGLEITHNHVRDCGDRHTRLALRAR
jgi:hypothetical protein